MRVTEFPGAAGLLALDPLLDGGLKWTPLVIVLIKIVVVFVVGLVGTMFMVWFERKIIAGMQNRIGPNKAGPWGILQTLADGLKLLLKEDLVPKRADRFVFALAPFLAFVPAFLVWSVIPLGGDFRDGNDGTVVWFGHETRVQLADPQIGILLVLALSSIAVYGTMLAGWASTSKYPLLGSVRASAQMVSYEASLALSVAAVVLMTGTLSTSGIVGVQDGIGDWNIAATLFVPFVIFVISATAELHRPPFELVEAEEELVSGFNTEYAGFRFALFYLAEFMNTLTMSGIIVTLFLGGPQPPKIGGTAIDIPFVNNGLEGTLWFVAKTFVFLYGYVWLRGTLPRFRYDQLMNLGWRLMIPLSLGWFLLLAYITVGRDDGWSRVEILLGMAAGLAVIAVGALLLKLALDTARRTRAREGAMF